MSRLTFRATQGTSYTVAVDGLAGKAGQYRLHWGIQPPNDDFASAQAIRRMTGTARVSDNAAATTQTGELRTGPHSVWYRWTAPGTGMVMFNSRRSDFASTVAVFRGTRLGRVQLVAIDRWGGKVQFKAAAGRTYRVAVSSFYGFWTGKVVLNWSRH